MKAVKSTSRGGRQSKAKPTPHQPRQAIKRREAGEPMRDIARDFGVSHSTVSRLQA